MNIISKSLTQNNQMTHDSFLISYRFIVAAAIAALLPAAALRGATLNVNGTTHTDSTAVNYGSVALGIHVFNGGTYKVVTGGDVTVNNQDSSDDIGIQLDDSSHFEMTGGDFLSKDTSSGSGKHGYGLITHQNSTFDISGGTFKATETGKGHNYIIQMKDNSSGMISGTAMLTGTETAQGNGKGVEINDNALLTVTGGSISHSSNDFNGSNLFILNSNDYMTLDESSTLDLSGGTFSLSANGENLTVFNINHASVANVSGGEVTSVSTSGDKNLAQIKHEAKLNLSGGKFPTGLDILFHDNSTDDALMTIFGSDFMFNGSPIGLGLVGSNTGVLSGILADGNAFSFDIDQNGNTNRILLAELSVAGVPEPGSFALWTSLLGIVLFRRRRRR
jgi:hypothetical protein